jgi:signal transduction histidine kinase
MAVRTTVGLEILATHLTLPVVITLGLASASDILRRLKDEQSRAQHLAVETERRRIAWELHDSAKQRLHAAHLVLSSLPPSEPLELALEQLQAAAATWRRASPSCAPRSRAARSATRSGAAPGS